MLEEKDEKKIIDVKQSIEDIDDVDAFIDACFKTTSAEDAAGFFKAMGTTYALRLINKKFGDDTLKYKQLLELIKDGKIDSIQNGTRNYQITKKGWEELCEYVKTSQQKKKQKKSDGKFYHNEILNNPVWDDKKNKLKDGKPFEKDYVLKSHKILTCTCNQVYDITIAGDWDDVKSSVKYDLFKTAIPLVCGKEKYNKKKHQAKVFEKASELAKNPSYWKAIIDKRIREFLKSLEIKGKAFVIYHDKDKIKQYYILEDGEKIILKSKDEIDEARSEEKQVYAEMIDKGLHVHIIFMFDEDVDYYKVYKAMNVSSEKNLEPPYQKKSYAGAFQYLVHETEKAIEDLKYNYKRSELIYYEYDHEKDNFIYENPISNHIHEYELYYREMNERVDYIKDNVQLGVWSVSDGYIVAKKFLSERDNNKLVENQTLEKQRERYLRNMVSKYNSGKKVMRRTNFAIMGVSQSGKNALAENWAKMKVDKGDDYFVSTPDMDGLAKDPFGRYNGQRVSVFNEFTEMPAPAFKNAFDKDNVGNVPRKGREGIPFVSELNFLTTADEPLDMIANMLQYSKGGKNYQNSLSLNHKPKRGFAGFSDEYHARSEYVQIGRRLNFLKINGDKIEVYQFVIINAVNEPYILRKFVNEDGSSLVNYRLVDVINGYNIADYPKVQNDKKVDEYNYKKRVEIAQNVAMKIEKSLDKHNAWDPLVVSERDNKVLFDQIMNDTQSAYGSSVNETVQVFFDEHYSKVKIPFLSWGLLYDFYARMTFYDFKSVKPLDRRDFEREFRELIKENISMAEFERFKFGGRLMHTQTDYYLTDNLSQENYRQKYKFLFTFDYRSSKISKESQLNGVLDMKHVRPFDPINPYRYEDYVQGGVTKDDFKKISQKVYDKRMADYGFVNRMLFDEIVDKIEQMY